MAQTILCSTKPPCGCLPEEWEALQTHCNLTTSLCLCRGGVEWIPEAAGCGSDANGLRQLHLPQQHRLRSAGRRLEQER